MNPADVTEHHPGVAEVAAFYSGVQATAVDPVTPRADPRPRAVRRPPDFIPWLKDFLQEQNGASSACRLGGLLCVLGALIVAIRDPRQWQTVTAFIGGGALHMLVRTKAVPGGPTP